MFLRVALVGICSLLIVMTGCDDQPVTSCGDVEQSCPDANATRCDGDSVQSCATNQEGCLVWAQPTACQKDQRCVVQDGVASCVDLSPTCGNGTAEGLESCDGSDLAGMTCAELDGFTGGTLACAEDCSFDTSLCSSPFCGDDSCDADETTTSCPQDCGSAPFCGDGIRESGEDCDGAALGDTRCEDLSGFTGGTLACANDCSFDTSLCTTPPVCGDGVRESGEDCDGEDLGDTVCEDLDGFTGGTLACASDCSLDLSSCTAFLCGDDRKEGSETCDGADLDGESCASRGFDTGTLACASDCRDFDISNCIRVPTDWLCDRSAYGTGDGCDCGCGGLDVDCADASADSCDSYHCSTGSWPSPRANWLCEVSFCEDTAPRLAAGDFGTCILQSNGNVDCRGIFGPYQYTLGDATGVSAGTGHLCVLKRDGNVDCYGENQWGEGEDYLGGDAVGVAAGNGYTCILKSDGNVDCYGNNYFGQSEDYLGGDAVGLAVHYGHVCVLKRDGNVDCYGLNTNVNGSIYVGQSEDYSGGDAVAVSVGTFHTCILKSDGNVDCYGANTGGQSEDYTGGDAVGIAAGGYHTCILKSDGKVDCYGFNQDSGGDYGGQSEDYSGGDAVGVAAGAYHTCVLKAAGNVECYGDTCCGQSDDYTSGDAETICR